MATLDLDTVEGSGFQLTGNAQREAYRGFKISDMNTVGVDPAELAGSALDVAGMPPMGSSHPDPRFAGTLLARIEVQGLLPNAVTGRLIYTTLTGATPTSYVVTRTSRTIDHSENVLPNGIPIQATYLAPGAPESQRITPICPMINVGRPSAVVIVEGLRYGSPNYPASDYSGFVNEDVWQGRPKGHWRIEEFTTRVAAYEGYHSFRFVALGNVLGTPWRNFVTMYDRSGVEIPRRPSDVSYANTFPYSYGTVSSDSWGFLLVFPYPETPFGAWGF